MLGRLRTLETEAAAHYHLPRPGHLSQRLAAETPHALLTGRGRDSKAANRLDISADSPMGEDVIKMSEEELAARRALQESMDLRDQGHSDD
jgi:hypothetical protein